MTEDSQASAMTMLLLLQASPMALLLHQASAMLQLFLQASEATTAVASKVVSRCLLSGNWVCAVILSFSKVTSILSLREASVERRSVEFLHQGTDISENLN